MAGVRKIPCIVTSVVNHGERIYNVTLEPQERLARFSAGQFLHLTLDPYDPASFWPESRVFSIASSPSRTDPLEILYSVKGRYTGRMELELQPGKEVWIKLPYGEFILDDINKPRVLFAGGTGISAFSSLLKAVLKSDDKTPVKLIYGIRNENLLFYRELIDSLARKELCEKIWLFVENGSVPAGDGIMTTSAGRIDFDAVRDEVCRGEEYDYYLAGPPVMLQSLTEKLLNEKVDTSRILLDKWE